MDGEESDGLPNGQKSQHKQQTNTKNYVTENQSIISRAVSRKENADLPVR